MGRKYLGKYKGQTRGPYEEALLFHKAKDDGSVVELESEVISYLSDTGYCVNIPSGYAFNDNHDLRTYHVAGATISMDTMKLFEIRHRKFLTPEEIEKQEERAKLTPYIQLHLVSNQGIDDVVQKIKDKFPFFKELDVKKKFDC